MTDRELMQQALERCVATCFDQRTHNEVMSRPEHFVNQNIPALSERLAQPEQEKWDAIPDAFNEWWNVYYDDTGNPYRKDSPAYWAWSGWKTASKQPEYTLERRNDDSL